MAMRNPRLPSLSAKQAAQRRHWQSGAGGANQLNKVGLHDEASIVQLGSGAVQSGKHPHGPPVGDRLGIGEARGAIDLIGAKQRN